MAGNGAGSIDEVRAYLAQLESEKLSDSMIAFLQSQAAWLQCLRSACAQGGAPSFPDTAEGKAACSAFDAALESSEKLEALLDVGDVG